MVHFDAQPGQIITFGAYPQSADGVAQPIQWRVLQKSDRELFLLSEYLLDCRRYHGESAEIKWRDAVDITWRDCDLPRWLTHTFYTTAFNPAEQALIQTTHCTGNGEGNPDTDDQVFLLSVAEIIELSETHGKGLRFAVGTEFAKLKKADGCRLYVYDKTNKDNYILQDGQEVGCSWWWLRTQGNKPSRAYFVGTGGSIRSYANVSVDGDGVRPAIKLVVP